MNKKKRPRVIGRQRDANKQNESKRKNRKEK